MKEELRIKFYDTVCGCCYHFSRCDKDIETMHKCVTLVIWDKLNNKRKEQ